MILFNRADPPARILASRRSLRMRACSDAVEGGVLGSDDAFGVASAILQWVAFERGLRRFKINRNSCRNRGCCELAVML